MNLQSVFDVLFDDIVVYFQHDFILATVKLSLKDRETSKVSTIIFDNVSSVLWTMYGFDGEVCTDIMPEVFSIGIDKITVNTDDRWLKGYPLNFNVALEIMDRALLINAKSCEIDGVKYII